MAKKAHISIPMLMVLPSLLLATGIIGYPILDLAWTSMQEVSRFGKLQSYRLSILQERNKSRWRLCGKQTASTR